MNRLSKDFLYTERTPSLSVALNLHSDEYFQFRDHNTIIASAYLEGASPDEVVALLKDSEFEFEGITIEDYVNNFIETLTKLGIAVEVR